MRSTITTPGGHETHVDTGYHRIKVTFETSGTVIDLPVALWHRIATTVLSDIERYEILDHVSEQELVAWGIMPWE